MFTFINNTHISIENAEWQFILKYCVDSTNEMNANWRNQMRLFRLRKSNKMLLLRFSRVYLYQYSIHIHNLFIFFCYFVCCQHIFIAFYCCCRCEILSNILNEKQNTHRTKTNAHTINVKWNGKSNTKFIL